MNNVAVLLSCYICHNKHIGCKLDTRTTKETPLDYHQILPHSAKFQHPPPPAHNAYLRQSFVFFRNFGLFPQRSHVVPEQTKDSAKPNTVEQTSPHGHQTPCTAKNRVMSIIRDTFRKQQRADNRQRWDRQRTTHRQESRNSKFAACLPHIRHKCLLAVADNQFAPCGRIIIHPGQFGGLRSG